MAGCFHASIAWSCVDLVLSAFVLYFRRGFCSSLATAITCRVARMAAAPPTSSWGDRLLRRDSSRLRSHVADRVQSDLLPMGRIVSMGLVLCEILAEAAVLVADRNSSCDRPLRLWISVLLVIQTVAVTLTALNVMFGRGTFHPHRLGLGASDVELYTGAPVTEPLMSSQVSSTATRVESGGGSSENSHSAHQPAGDPLLPATYLFGDYERSPENESAHYMIQSYSNGLSDGSGRRGGSTSSRSSSASSTINRAGIVWIADNDIVDRYLRVVNVWLLIWFVIGSVWVSDGGTCVLTAPHIYRISLVLIVIYFALLFLPLTCFCLIVCCLPLFIIVYRILLPLSERERRRARAADQSLINSLPCTRYEPPVEGDTNQGPSSSTSNRQNDARDDEECCVICLCAYELGELVCTLPCKHRFHADCISSWLRLDKSCALCKQDIDINTVANNDDERSPLEDVEHPTQGDSSSHGDSVV